MSKYYLWEQVYAHLHVYVTLGENKKGYKPWLDGCAISGTVKTKAAAIAICKDRAKRVLKMKVGALIGDLVKTVVALNTL